jgi:hypothetical protein
MNFGFYKMQGISSLSDRLSAIQGLLSGFIIINVIRPVVILCYTDASLRCFCCSMGQKGHGPMILYICYTLCRASALSCKTEFYLLVRGGGEVHGYLRNFGLAANN